MLNIVPGDHPIKMDQSTPRNTRSSKRTRVFSPATMQRNKRAKAAQPDPPSPASPNTQFWLVQNDQRAAHTASLASQASQADLKLKIIDAEVALEQMKNLLSAEVHQEEARQRAITHRNSALQNIHRCWRGDLPADAMIAIFSSAGPRSR